MWSEQAKQSMTEAAERAGMIRGSPHELIIVLEPEAAALYARKDLRETFPL